MCTINFRAFMHFHHAKWVGISCRESARTIIPILKGPFLLPQITGVVAAVLRSAQPPASLDDFQLSLSTSSGGGAGVRRSPGCEPRSRRHSTPSYTDGKMIKVGNIFYVCIKQNYGSSNLFMIFKNGYMIR